MDSGGQIMLGTVKPLAGAAVAHDGKKTLAMLHRRAAEAVADLMIRLDAAIATAQYTGSRVDEINKPSIRRAIREFPQQKKKAARRQP
jgi:hypothetical protein